MLRLTIPETELWDDKNNEFFYVKEQTLTLEHSLVSLSKWEANWNKPFLTKDKKTDEETIDYIKCMTITQNVDPIVYALLRDEHIIKINNYIDAPMTATWFSGEENKKTSNSEQVTSELIYYWMIALNIPFECQKWHLNRLLTLVKVCNIKNQPKKKRTIKEIIDSNKAINEARKKKYNSRG